MGNVSFGFFVRHRLFHRARTQHFFHADIFRRIHRNALVNVDHVRKMSPLSSQRWLITMNNDQEYVASKRQARTVRELLTW